MSPTAKGSGAYFVGYSVVTNRLPSTFRLLFYYNKKQKSTNFSKKIKIESVLSKKKDGKRKMKTLKRLLWVLFSLIIMVVIGYFVYTGCQL